LSATGPKYAGCGYAGYQATRLAPILDALTLCKMFGWSNTTRTLTHYNPSANQIATRLDAIEGAAITPNAVFR